jgi:LysM domain
MSVMSTGRRPGAAVRRLSPEDAYLLLHPTAGKRPGRPRLRLVPPVPAGPAEKLPPAPPRGRTPASADARVPAPRAGSARPAARAPMSPPAATAAPHPQAAPAAVTAPVGAATRSRVARPAQGAASARPVQPARIVRTARRPVSHGRVRLTRRGRLVVWALAALTAAAVLIPVWLLAAGGAQAANHGLPPAAVHAGLRQVVVRPGQTLWSIAMAAEPTADPRVVTQEIIQVNALSNQVLVPGESLWVPAS